MRAISPQCFVVFLSSSLLGCTQGVLVPGLPTSNDSGVDAAIRDSAVADAAVRDAATNDSANADAATNDSAVADVAVKDAASTTYFPAAGEPWRTETPASQGMSLDALRTSRSLMATYEEEPLTSVTGIVIRHGYEVWRYGDPYATRKSWASCSRSVMTAQFGMLIHEELVAGGPTSVDAPVNQIVGPEAQTYGDAILLKHLLSYTSCASPPGSGWSYSCNFFSMHKIVEDLDGAFPIMRIEQLLGPAIGADFRASEYWGQDDQFESPLAILEATEADAARWGYLWLKRGTWADRVVVDAWFVDRSVQPMPSPNGGYAHSNEGWQIHLNANGMWGDIVPHDAYSALGASGSVIFVCPSLELVAALKVAPHPYGHVAVGGEIHRDIRNLMEPIIEAVVDR